MQLERIVVGLAAALWAAFVPGAAKGCLDHHWSSPSRWLRRRARAVEPGPAAVVARVDTGSVG